MYDSSFKKHALCYGKKKVMGQHNFVIKLTQNLKIRITQ